MTTEEEDLRAIPLKLIRVGLDDGYLDDAIAVTRIGNIAYEVLFFYEDNPFQSWNMVFEEEEPIWRKY